MNKSFSIKQALCLPAPDIEALIQGRSIAAMPRISLSPGNQQFALYPCETSDFSGTVRYYRSNFLAIAQRAVASLDAEQVLIKAWAECEYREYLDNAESFNILSQLTVWTEEALQEMLKQRQDRIFLTYLRVYLLPQPVEVPRHPAVEKRKGKFVPLPHSLTVSETMPVLSDRLFGERRNMLKNRQPPLHPELEALQGAIAQLGDSNLAAKELDRDIQSFLGWRCDRLVKQPDDLPWINNIAALGNRSKELDKGKSNYLAGTDFENVVRDSLEFLGFTVDYAHKGGAGGLDLFCSKPYPLFGECKAGKKIPNNTAVQLLNLGTIRGGEELLKQAAKLIIGPGEPTPQLKDAARVHGMAIINPETLENLVKLEGEYRGSVDLFKLKDCLKPGASDEEVEKYIQQVRSEIELRSRLVDLVKNYLENSKSDSAGVETLHGAYFSSNPPQSLTPEQLQEILIELSSPLTGYLGRKGDRFYFLRPLLMDA